MQVEGVYRGRAVLIIMLLAGHFELQQILDTVFLADTVVLRLPMAFGAAQAQISHKEKRWRSAHCGRFRHCRGLYADPSQAKAAAALIRRTVPGAAAWRCDVAIRVLRRRSLLSNNIRAKCTLQCEGPVVEVLRRHGLAIETSLLHHRSASDVALGSQDLLLRYVDVGASLGDCALAAASLVPEGHLHVLSFDVDAETVALMRESVALNRLRAADLQQARSHTGAGLAYANASSVEVRHVALVGPAAGMEVGVLFAEDVGAALASRRCPGGAPVPPMPREVVPVLQQIRASTLDMELENFQGRIDVLTVFANSAEMDVLQGAEKLLLAKRVRCLLAIANGCPDRGAALEEFLRSMGYRTERMGSNGRWIAASPEEEAAAAGRICSPRFAATSMR
eukprot:gnl/TRDRNA2_/TRDRNA2_136746_c1_seq1.p1 gnl/TRDRNA2_/TRDRNA2_136746_c1~~gnl/TRDRNA2_/TRDRNA2_136746_c1_seq1.p1  ORF type:complete len:411 (+),score=65.65 gnl/TRDRNA2_/TRDRNA2_136746_c1_seq1:54-1235(+)